MNKEMRREPLWAIRVEVLTKGDQKTEYYYNKTASTVKQNKCFSILYTNEQEVLNDALELFRDVENITKVFVEKYEYQLVQSEQFLSLERH